MEWANNEKILYPWRIARTPYKVLISEFLLTRTKANQVIDVYNKFILKYPSFKELENASYNDIYNILSSLGLHYRVEKLLNLNKQINEKFNGIIPNTLDELKSLKGIGDYNANAILCFGFNERRALLETNFIRIYGRVFNIKSKSKTPKNDKFLWNFSLKILPDKDYIFFNYSIIDFGKKICIPKNQKCNSCPLTVICYYFNSI